MNNTNTITFKYRYPESLTDKEKSFIDHIIMTNVTKVFWQKYHEGLITDFQFIDEDMEEGVEND